MKEGALPVIFNLLLLATLFSFASTFVGSLLALALASSFFLFWSLSNSFYLSACNFASFFYFFIMASAKEIKDLLR
jgi:hypothetical protein